jgi:hypothetical protein
MFDDQDRTFFGVIPDEVSFAEAATQKPGIRWFDDRTGAIRKLYAADTEGRVLPRWVLIDPMGRVIGWLPLEAGERFMAGVAALGPAERHARVETVAPVLLAPRVLEPALCRRLIEYYDTVGGEPSGVMQEREGMTVAVMNDSKRRDDCVIADPALRRALRQRLTARPLPEIEKVFHFRTTHVERYIVGRYGSENRGYFRAHRDNTNRGTAHRQFAVTINLNDGFTGGDLRFPEYSRRTHRPPPGAAVVFSCALLHEVTPVTDGVRYAFLPFLYDAAGHRIREANRMYVAADTVLGGSGS